MLSRDENRTALSREAATLAPTIASFPAVIYLESQRGCPYDCIMCTVPKTYGRKPSEMPDAVLDRLRPYFQYIETLAIHGNGEALLSRNIDEYIDIAQENDCFLHCNTTGFPLNKRLNDKLLEAKLDLRFSIHAGSEKSYKRVMNEDLWPVMENIGYLLERSRARGHKENTFWFSCIVMKENVDEMFEFIDLAHKVGIEKVRFMNLHPNHRTLLGTRRNDDEERFIHLDQSNSSVSKRFNEQLPELRKKAEELGITIGSGNMEHWVKADAAMKDLANRISNKAIKKNIFPLKPIPGKCLVPWTGQVQVEQNGDIGLCCSVKHNIGNVLERDFAEIWHSHHMNELRKTFNAGKQPSVCGYCRGVGTKEYDIPVNREIDKLLDGSGETESTAQSTAL